MPSRPPNATLVQVGFKFGLNYEFVIDTPTAAGEIMRDLPQGLAYGLGISADQVLMNALVPYPTTGEDHFIVTLAQAYIPTDLVNRMALDLHIRKSAMYHNPDKAVNALMQQINPTISLIPGANMDSVPASATYNPAATASSAVDDGAPIGGDSGNSNKVKGSAVGIGVGAVCGAAVYAAAMIYVARRYRQKRQNHRRANSVPRAGEMSQTSGGGMGGFFMSGANGHDPGSGSGGRGSRTSGHSSNGRSVREQGISGPIMAENSLGWS